MTEAEAYQIILADSMRERRDTPRADYVGYYFHCMWKIPKEDVPFAVQWELFRRAEAEALSAAWGVPVRVFCVREGNGHGTWEVRKDWGPVCTEVEWFGDCINPMPEFQALLEEMKRPTPDMARVKELRTALRAFGGEVCATV